MAISVEPPVVFLADANNGDIITDLLSICKAFFKGMTIFVKKMPLPEAKASFSKIYFLDCWIKLTTTITAPNRTPAMAQINQLYCGCMFPNGPKVYSMKMAVTSSQ